MQPPMMMPPPNMPPPPKKGMSGCMIAFIVVSIVGFVTAIVVGIVVYLVATSSTAQTAFKIVGGSAKLATKGLNAPGTPEIRAMGCEQAMVLDMNEFAQLMNEAFDGGLGDSGMQGLEVECSLSASAAPLACDDVAKTYLRAVGGTASAELAVRVKRQNDTRPLCESTYDTDGTLLSTGNTLGTSKKGGI
jgi:hypothetical protein